MTERRLRRLTKVIMEYNNGDREYIDGDDVKKWQDALNSSIVLSYIHESEVQEILKNIVWKKIG